MALLMVVFAASIRALAQPPSDCESIRDCWGLKPCRYGLRMGLSIYRSIIEAHGGRLWVSPRAPHGADVRFTVPVWAEP
jgi:hypothetical protein